MTRRVAFALGLLVGGVLAHVPATVFRLAHHSPVL